MTLDQLSAAATELLPCPFCSDPMQLYGYDLIAHVNSGNCIIGKQAWQASDKNIAAWSHRTGQLVAVSDDAIERVARAMFIKELGEPDDWDKWQSLLQEYRNLASTAIAAMKDTQP